VQTADIEVVVVAPSVFGQVEGPESLAAQATSVLLLQPKPKIYRQ